MGDRVATLVSLTLTPLVIEDGLARWDGRSEQVPCDGYAILFGRSIAAGSPTTCRPSWPGGDGRLRRPGADRPGRRRGTTPPVGRGDRRRRQVRLAGLAAARDAGAGAPIGVVPHRGRGRRCSRASGLADEVVVADARDPVALRDAVAAAGGPADVTVVCVDVPGCEGGAILATADGGTVIFFSMATSFSAAALGAEGLAADVTMLVGNGYVPGHADYALRAAPRARRRPAPVRAPTGGDADEPGKLDLDPVTVRKARALARKAGRPIVTLAQQHTTVSVERATLRLAGLEGADADGTPVGQPAARRRTRRRRPRARRRAAGLGRAAPRRGRRPDHAGAEGGRRLGARSGCPRAATPQRARAAARTPGRRRHHADRRAAAGARPADRASTATPRASRGST